MKKKKIILDVCLTLLLGCQMAYSLISEVSHEITGICMVALLVLHHILNGGFHRHLFNGRYSPYRVALTAIDTAMLVIFLIQGISGLMMAKHIRLFNVTGANWSRQAHLAGAYWCFVLCGIHAGLHMTGLVRKWQKNERRGLKVCVALIVIAFAAYGAVAFAQRGFPNYMTLRQQFVFFDYSEPLPAFFRDYIFILFLWMAVGCGIGCVLTRRKR